MQRIRGTKTFIFFVVIAIFFVVSCGDKEVKTTNDVQTIEMPTELSEEGQSESTEKENLPEKERPKVKGIYVTGNVAGSERMDDLIALVDATELNTMVIDVKNDEGEIT